MGFHDVPSAPLGRRKRFFFCFFAFHGVSEGGGGVHDVPSTPLGRFFCASRTRFWFSRRTKCASRTSFFRFFFFSTLVHTLNPLSIDTFLTTQSTTPCSCINYSKYSQLTYQQHITQTTHIPIIHDLLPKLLTHQLFACYFSCSMLSPGGAREEEGWYPENSESL